MQRQQERQQKLPSAVYIVQLLLVITSEKNGETFANNCLPACLPRNLNLNQLRNTPCTAGLYPVWRA